MCGICGFIGFDDPELLRAMTGMLAHRGPDAEGFFQAPGVALGHRRLSIIDLASGDQPLFNEDKTVCVVFNGEIYNYRELRAELAARGHVFRTKSDTEVIVHAYEEAGERCVERFNGDFAFALWDARDRSLLLARDRLGIRPLTYCRVGNAIAFASELNALLQWEKAPRELSPVALDCFFTLRYVPAAMTMFSGVEKLPPAHTLTFRDGRIRLRCYWNLPARASHPLPFAACVEGFRDLLEDSVRLRLMSEVPLGVHLSGGVDSCSIATLMSRYSSTPVKTFTVGGFGGNVDESAKAAAQARRIGADHTLLSVERQSFELLPHIVGHLDSPVGDAIVIPIYMLARETARHVKVVLSGEGADEILAGYVHQLTLNHAHRIGRYAPGWALALARETVRRAPVGLLNRFFPYPAALGYRGRVRLASYLEALRQGTPGQEFLALVSLFEPGEREELADWKPLRQAVGQAWLRRRLDGELSRGPAFFDSVLRFDLRNWLADNTLLKQDHLSMAHSLEARVPFLDHRLVEYAVALPDAYKIRGMVNKVLLRKSMKGILPDDYARAKKKAFYIPTETCFGREFDVFVRDVLLSERTLSRGIFNKKALERRLQTVRSTELIDNKQVFALLIMELWCRNFVDGEGLRRPSGGTHVPISGS